MTEEERQILLNAIEKRTQKALKSKEAALKYLVELGILTKDGNFTPPYNQVCTPEEAA